MRYAIKLALADGAYIATCRDLPAFNSVGNSPEEALRESVDALVLSLWGYIDEGRPIPEPSAKQGDERWVTLPSGDMAEIGLRQAK